MTLLRKRLPQHMVCSLLATGFWAAASACATTVPPADPGIDSGKVVAANEFQFARIEGNKYRMSGLFSVSGGVSELMETKNQEAASGFCRGAYDLSRNGVCMASSTSDNGFDSWTYCVNRTVTCLGGDS